LRKFKLINRFLLFLTLAVFVFITPPLMALPKAAVFVMPAESPSIISLINETYRRTIKCLELLGRFEIVEQNLLETEWNASSNLSFADECEDTARRTGASLLIILTAYQTGTNSFGEAVVRPIDPQFSAFRKNIRVRTRIMRNVPYLIEREIALMHEGMPLHFTVKREGMNTLIDAGTQSGLSVGSYQTSAGTITITRVTSRTATVSQPLSGNGRNGRILIYPRVREYLVEPTAAIQEGIEYRYGPGYAYLRGEGYDKRYAESIFVINPLGNLILPGYSSWLSVNYLGIEGPQPSYWTMSAGAAIYLYQLLWMPVSSEFKENFFPFIDGSKTEGQKRYHTWLWATIPVNFTVCYFDHLSLQYAVKEILPPFFESRDSTAAILSVLVPGGGHFYKGSRLFGWSYYGTEFLLFGYGIYHAEEKIGKQVLLAAGAVKLIDVLHAYFSKPSYTFYNHEFYSEETTSFFSDVAADSAGDMTGLLFQGGVEFHY